MQDVIVRRFARGDGAAVSIIAVGVIFFIDVAVTVQVHVSVDFFALFVLVLVEFENFNFLISTAKVDDGACITVNSSSSWTAGSSFDGEGVTVDVDLRPRSISSP